VDDDDDDDVLARFCASVARMAICKTASRAPFCHLFHSLSFVFFADPSPQVSSSSGNGRVKQYPRRHEAMSRISVLSCDRSDSVILGSSRNTPRRGLRSKKTSCRYSIRNMYIAVASAASVLRVARRALSRKDVSGKPGSAVAMGKTL